MTKRLKVYELYGCQGMPSARTIDYTGYVCQVAAKSIRQAYFLACSRIWVENIDKPLGILAEVLGKGQQTRLFDGSRTWGMPFKHGAGIRQITAKMESLHV